MNRILPAHHLSNSPLVQVLAQVRFSPVLTMEDYVPRIQEKLRKKYPRFTRTDVQEVQLGPTPQIQKNSLWAFLNKEESTCISLTKNFVTLSTNKYQTFEDFVEELSSVLEDVNSIVESQLVERLGLRYVDLIRLQSDESFEQYFDKRLMGLSREEVGATESISRIELVGRTDVGGIVVRCSETVDGSFLPPDLSGSNLKYGLSLENGEKVRLLDVDHFSEESRNFVTTEIVDAIWQLHHNCDMAFRKSVTDYAREQWQAKEIAK